MNSKRTLCGIDISSEWSDVVIEKKGARTSEQRIKNEGAGYKQLIRQLGKNARVCLEATGVYHLALAMALVEAGVEVMVVNPRMARDFAKALSTRAKTDRVDAGVLLEYARRMPFVRWQAPRRALSELRALGRRMEDLTGASRDEKNRAHAEGIGRGSSVVRDDIAVNLRHLSRRIRKIETEAIAVIKADEQLAEQYGCLLRAMGIGKRTAVLLLAELALLDEAMSERQVVAYAGLDPRPDESGKSTDKPARISRVGNARLRGILFLPALAAIRHDANVRRFYERLLGRGKKKMQAIVAVMRKLLHGIWIAMQRRVAFDSAKLFPLPPVGSELGQSSAMAKSSDLVIDAPQPERKRSHPKGRSEAEELRQQLDFAGAEATPSKPRSKVPGKNAVAA